MRRLASVLGVVLALGACAATVPRRGIDVAVFSRREGPVKVGVDLLVDGATQQRWVGHTLDERLIAQLLPIGVVVENSGTRPVAIRESGIVLELRTRGEHTPLDPAAAVTALQAAYDAILAGGPPRAEYPTAESMLIRSRALCATTGVGCLFIPPAVFLGGIVDTGHLFAERAQYPWRQRALKRDLTELRAREEAYRASPEAWIAQGQTGQRLVYVPLETRNTEALSEATVTVRLAVPAGSEIVVPVRLGPL
jgi:hypothetical protein